MVDEVRELENNPSFYTGTGKQANNKKSKIGLKILSPLLIFGILAIGIIIFFFSLGNLIPDTISTNLTEATDVQCANGTIDKEWAFIEILRQGQVPSDTIEHLKESNILIGNLDEFGNFTESASGTTLKKDDQILSDVALYDAFQNDAELYTAFNKATYSCAAFYYDDAAKQTFRQLGTTRNNYTEDSDYKEVMNKAVNNGNNIKTNTGSKVRKTRKNEETGEEEVYYTYEASGSNSNYNDLSSEEIIESTRKQNPAATATESALNTADVLKIADTASKEQRSSSFFLYFIENINKVKAGDGNASKIHEAMDFLTTSTTNEIVDTKTGEVITVTGSPVESPSLYKILSGGSFSTEEVRNFSSDRILQTVENKLDLSVATTTPVNNSVAKAITSSIASISNNLSGSIFRFLTSTIETVEFSVLAPLMPTISSSLINNSYSDSISGISGGEMLVEGAVNVGKKLAVMGSGATAGDSNSVLAYNHQVVQIAKLNAESERLTKSPFDITSKNTFLGSIAYSLIPLLTKTGSFKLSILPTVSADDEDTYLSNFGNCETLSTINAVGTGHCSVIATFDTSTQYDPYNNQEFLDFVDQNTYLDNSGNRKVKTGSYLADFIKYNNTRNTPLGTIDSTFLSNIKHQTVTSKIEDALSLFNEASDETKAIASGAAFTNSENNPYWNRYKYAQRYVSINRAVSILKQFSNDKTAYNNLTGFEGNNDPIIAFMEENNLVEDSTIIANFNTGKKETESKGIKPLNTRNNDLVVFKVPHQTTTPTLVQLGKYIIKQDDWSEA